MLHRILFAISMMALVALLAATSVANAAPSYINLSTIPGGPLPGSPPLVASSMTFYDGGGASAGEVTVTGSADVVLSSSTLGIVGGYRDEWLDGNETMTFAFLSSGATGVGILPGVRCDGCNPLGTSNGVYGEAVFDVYGLAGLLLGSFTPTWRSSVNTNQWISPLVGNQLITQIRVTSINGDAIGIREIFFDDGTTTIPEPETYALMLTGLGIMGWMVRRQNRQTVGA